MLGPAARVFQNWNDSCRSRAPRVALPDPAVPRPAIHQLVNTGFRIERVDERSSLIDDAARLHVACLPGTLTSRRGASAVAGIYRRLVSEGHSLYVALEEDSLLGGLMVIVHGNSRLTLFTISHRPRSWVSVLSNLGVLETLQQLRDLARVTHHIGRLVPHDYIVAVYVDERARRLGVARSLLARAVDDSSLRGVKVGVDTLKDNYSARQLYLTFGFHEVFSTSRSKIFIWEPERTCACHQDTGPA